MEMSKRIWRLREQMLRSVTAAMADDEPDNLRGELGIDGNIYRDNLPPTITQDMADQVHAYDADFVAAALETIGDLALRALEKDPDYQGCSTTVQVSKNIEIVASIGINKEAEEGGPVVITAGLRNLHELDELESIVATLSLLVENELAAAEA